MPSAEQTLNIARSYLGEGPARFVNWYPAPMGTAWCAIFQSYVLSQVGIQTHYAWVSGLFDQYRREGRTFAPREAQPGDLVAFDYDGGGRSAYDHIAMVESVTSDGIIAINGNWSNKVQRVLHRWNAGGFAGGIAEIARPAYTQDPEPEDEEVKSLLMIDRRQNPAPVYHACGNTKVWLSKQEQVDALRFLGVAVLDPAPPAWLDALATIPRG